MGEKELRRIADATEKSLREVVAEISDAVRRGPSEQRRAVMVERDYLRDKLAAAERRVAELEAALARLDELRPIVPEEIERLRAAANVTVERLRRRADSARRQAAVAITPAELRKCADDLEAAALKPSAQGEAT